MTVDTGNGEIVSDCLQESTWQLRLNLLDLIIIACKSARLCSDFERVELHLRRAKRFYGKVLLTPVRHRLHPQDIGRLELGCVRLEREISLLEGKLRDWGEEPCFSLGVKTYL